MLPTGKQVNSPIRQPRPSLANLLISGSAAATSNTAALLLYAVPIGHMFVNSYNINRLLKISVPYGYLTGLLSITAHSLIPNDSPLKTSPKLERSISAVISVVSSLLTLAVMHAVEYGVSCFEEQAVLFTALTLSAFVAIQVTKYLSRPANAHSPKAHSA